jgi:hypothetical protein
VRGGIESGDDDIVAGLKGLAYQNKRAKFMNTTVTYEAQIKVLEK